jgi:hypothetical protein
MSRNVVYRVELDNGISFVKNDSHDNIFVALGPGGEHDVKGLYSIYGYYDMHHRWSTPLFIITAPYEVKRSTYPIYPISIPQKDLDKWIVRMWDEHCAELGIRQMKNGLGPLIKNMNKKRTTVEEFLDYLKDNQHTYEE